MERLSVADCDGHLVESITELAEYMEPSIREVALDPSRNRQGVFPSLDGYHYPSSHEGESQDCAGRTTTTWPTATRE